MKVEVVGTTNNIRSQRGAKRIIQNHARKCYTEKGWSELLDESFMPGLVKTLIDRGHHSPFDHFAINMDFDRLPKVLAMVFNNQGVYTTSEKSARYTKMKISDHQLGLYNKWDNWFLNEISDRFPESEFPRLFKKGSDGKSTAGKLSQENARYMTSVFTPTSMTHSVSWRQANILYHGFKDFIAENEGSSDKFKANVADSMKDYVGSPDVKKWIIKEAQVRMKGGIPLRFLRDGEVEEHFGEDVYSTNYNASFASLAQLHRHRLATYDISNGWQKGLPLGAYVPRLIEAAGKVAEWKKDLGAVGDYDFPQAQLLRVGERGMREQLPAKTLERECGLAQLETARVVGSLLEKYSAQVPAMGGLAVPACESEGGCHRGGCTFGADKYLTRLI